MTVARSARAQLGLPAHRPYFLHRAGRAGYAAAIAAEPLAYRATQRPRSTATSGSSCSACCSKTAAARRSTRQFAAWRDAALPASRSTSVRGAARAHTSRRPRPTPGAAASSQGEVHDENAAALGGVAGHAGLFGTAAAVGAFARWFLGCGSGTWTPRPACRRHWRRGSRHAVDGARQLARARLGHDAAELLVRHGAVRHARSAIPASPARRCGSIRRAISTSCCSPTACIPSRPTTDGIQRAARRRARRRRGRLAEHDPDHARLGDHRRLLRRSRC